MKFKQRSLRKIFKINSTRIKRANWDLNISLEEAIENKEVINISDSQLVRMVDRVNNSKLDEKLINKIKKQEKRLKNSENTYENRKKIAKLYQKKSNLMFFKDYIFVIADSKADFDRLKKSKGFYINGVKFKRLVGMTGGIKKSTVAFMSEDMHNIISKKMDCDRDQTVPLIPAKLEAYKALTCSSSSEVTNPNRILVVNDSITKFKDNVIEVDDREQNPPIMKYIEGYDIELEESDGNGLISPEFSKRWAEDLELDYLPSGFCIRNAYTKGMLYTFDFKDFADKVANNYMVEDVWGEEHDIREVDVILTTSMLKLWKCYESISHYVECCKRNWYHMSVTKVCPKELESQRNMNYQFLQSFKLSDEDIDELINPTVNYINDVLGGDYRKSLLFLKGTNITSSDFIYSDTSYSKAMMIDKRVFDDPFIKQKIHNYLYKRIQSAKIGILQVKGNYQIISSDPYILCQSIFGMELTGLLKSGEVYSRYWADEKVNEIAVFRAPMSCYNNIRKVKVPDTDEMKYWYKYMPTVMILNGWDTIKHALNGSDQDGDTYMSTNNSVILRNLKNTPAIFCVQKSGEKIPNITEKMLAKSNKDGFGDGIGTVTNRVTTMYELQAAFDKDSPEYKELDYRITCGQNYQQNEIDKIKGIVCNKMPKEWYNRKSCEVKDGDTEEIIRFKEFNNRIVADKKPYFFRYIYPDTMNKHKSFLKDSSSKCKLLFGMELCELFAKKDKTDEEMEFLKYYDYFNPVVDNNSVMNQICHKIECEFDDFRRVIKQNSEFDYSIYKSGVEYTTNTYNKIKKAYDDYRKEQQQFVIDMFYNRHKRGYDSQKTKHLFREKFLKRCYEICNNKYTLCDIILDVCYTKNTTKEFAWDVIGDVVIENLLRNNNNSLKYPVLDEFGDIDFFGRKYIMITKNLEEFNDRIYT